MSFRNSAGKLTSPRLERSRIGLSANCPEAQWADGTNILIYSPAENHTSPVDNENHTANLCLLWKIFLTWTYVGRGYCGYLTSWKPFGGGGSAPNGTPQGVYIRAYIRFMW